MRLYLVRHGQSILNADADSTGEMNLHQGQTDSPLSQHGIEQAKKLAKRLKNDKFDIIYSSDLQRAHHTALEIHQFHKETKLLIDKRLRERSKGDFEGKPKTIYKEDELEGDIYSRRAPNGENYYDHKERLEDFLNEILHKHEIALIVSHGWTTRILLHILTNVPKEDIYINKKFPSSNTSIYIIDINEEGVKLILENCTKHLD